MESKVDSLTLAQSFLEEHPAYKALRSNDAVKAVHCFYCDHECVIDTEYCCMCGAEFPLMRAIWSLRDRSIITKSTSSATFSKFCSLPTELRIKIWSYALPGPRIVGLKADTTTLFVCDQDPDLTVWAEEVWFPTECSSAHGGRCKIRRVVSFRPACPNPAMLFVCRESRDIASKIYTLTIGSNVVAPRTWFNFELDTLYLDFGVPHHRHYSVLKDLPDVSRVQKMAFFPIFNTWILHSESSYTLDNFIKRILTYKFLELRELKLVLKRHGRSEYDNLALDEKVYDVDQSLAFFSQPYDRARARKFFKDITRPRFVGAYESGTVDQWTRTTRRIREEEGFSPHLKISCGVVMPDHKLDLLNKTIEGWIAQRALQSNNNSEYRLRMNHVFLDDFQPSQTVYLAPFSLFLDPSALVSAIEARAREVWVLSKSTQVTLMYANHIILSPEARIGDLEYLHAWPCEDVGMSEFTQTAPGIFEQSVPVNEVDFISVILTVVAD